MQNEYMVVTKAGKYMAKNGNVYDVLNMGTASEPYFRAFANGGWYNVNTETNNEPFDQIEIGMVKYVGPLEKNS